MRERFYLFFFRECHSVLFCRSEQIISVQTASVPGHKDHPGQREGSHQEFRGTLQVRLAWSTITIALKFPALHWQILLI